MFQSCTKKYTDESDERTYRFTFYCDICGKPVYVKPVNATQAVTDAGAQTKKALAEVCWQKEHTAAFMRADSEIKDKRTFDCLYMNTTAIRRHSATSREYNPFGPQQAGRLRVCVLNTGSERKLGKYSFFGNICNYSAPATNAFILLLRAGPRTVERSENVARMRLFT